MASETSILHKYSHAHFVLYRTSIEARHTDEPPVQALSAALFLSASIDPCLFYLWGHIVDSNR